MIQQVMKMLGALDTERSIDNLLLDINKEGLFHLDLKVIILWLNQVLVVIF